MSVKNYLHDKVRVRIIQNDLGKPMRFPRQKCTKTTWLGQTNEIAEAEV